MRAFPSAVLAALLVGPVPAGADEPARGAEKKVSGQVVAAVEKELDRLKEQQKQEEEKAGLGSPSPSGEVAYLLLQGLAARSTRVAKPSAEDVRTFALESKGGAVYRLYEVNGESRLVEEDAWHESKAGRYHVHGWRLYVLQDGKWGHRGFGESGGPHVK